MDDEWRGFMSDGPAWLSGWVAPASQPAAADKRSLGSSCKLLLGQAVVWIRSNPLRGRIEEARFGGGGV
jgi:hypothetical protein